MKICFDKMTSEKEWIPGRKVQQRNPSPLWLPNFDFKRAFPCESQEKVCISASHP